MTPELFTFDRLPEITVAEFTTGFVTDSVTDSVFFVFQVGGEIVWCDTSLTFI